MKTVANTQDIKHAPLSTAQERYWVLEQVEPGVPAHNACQVFRLEGKLQAFALEKSLAELVRRHEILRTVYKDCGGKPQQMVVAAEALRLDVANLYLPPADRERQIQKLLLQELRKPFDLTSDLMLRATLAKCGEAEHILLLTVHKIAADASALKALGEQLEILYNGLVAAQPTPLPPLKSQYADFALWQAEWLQSEPANSQLAFWKRRLAGMPSLFEFPMGRPRPAKPTFGGCRHKFTLDPSILEGLRALGQRHNCSLSTTLLAAFMVLASRYSGRKDVVVGVAGLPLCKQRFPGVLGNFSNTVILRTDSGGDPSFVEFLSQTDLAIREAEDNGQFPLERLIEELKPPRDHSYHPLFQVRFCFEEKAPPESQSAPVAFSPLEIDPMTTETDLGLYLRETASGLEGWIEYATDLFEADAIERMAGHFLTILKSASDDPAKHLSRLELLTQPERRQLLVEWNNTKLDCPPNECLHHLFEAQVKRSPQSIALIEGHNHLSYRELNRRANGLAHRLQKMGVGPDVLVGIFTNRSMEMVIALLAVLKAGGAYVPLDAAYPAERLAFILRDADLAVLLTQRDLTGTPPAYQGQIVFLDDPQLWAEDNSSDKNPHSETRPGNLAYVIYTSGSTGQPKGVAIEHHSPVTFVRWAQTVFSAQELAGVLASTSICFDLSIFEIFVPLAVGGKIVLAENALQLPELPAAWQVTLINTVPSAIAELIRSRSIPLSVTTVNLAGEPLETKLVEQIYEQGSVAKVYDLYGPSEDTTYSTFALRSKDAPATIGRPIANTRVYLLDEDLQPVPLGLPGELYLAGDGLARGYLNRPELTAEKFIDNPFEKEPGARLYKTGDLARYFPDGKLEFLGRKDNQVKIRGFRIELGEIETVLRQDPLVQAAAVIAGEDGRGGKRLVAYVVGQPQEQSSSPTARVDAPASTVEHDVNQALIAQLRAWVKKKLPEYMMPSVFVPLPALPMTPNGKVDRKALPKPEQLRLEMNKGFVPPRTTTEQILAGIWCEVLGVEKVGINDNFFEIGGHSLMAIQVISRLRETAQVETTMRHFFETPTIAGLAELIEGILVEEISQLSDDQAQSLVDSA